MSVRKCVKNSNWCGNQLETFAHSRQLPENTISIWCACITKAEKARGRDSIVMLQANDGHEGGARDS